MSRLLWCLLWVALAGCEQPGTVPESQPPPLRTSQQARIPVELRQHNYGPSCWHASMITVLRWQGRPDAAAWWRRHGYGPQNISGVEAICRRAGLRYASTRGDVRFLEWVSRTRRAAGVHWQYRHATTFAGFRDGMAIVIDNRSPHRETKVPRAAFVRAWKSHGGHAITVLDRPRPPKPWAP